MYLNSMERSFADCVHVVGELNPDVGNGSTITPVCDLFVAPASGGEARRLTNDQRMIYGMAWTLDGREIVFASTRQNSMRLWRVQAHPAMQTGVFEAPKSRP